MNGGKAQQGKLDSGTTVLFRGIDASDALRNDIHAHAERLRKLVGEIRACKVVVAMDARHQQHGNRYRVDIHLTMDGIEIDTGLTRAHGSRHEDPYVAVADAFDAMRRHVETRTQRRDAVRRGRAAAGAS